MNKFTKAFGNTWLGKLYRKSKLIFVLALLFFTGTLFFNFIQLETTPFFVWDMYKNPLPDKDDHEIYLVQYNGNNILNFNKTWKEPQKIYLTSPLFYYMLYRQQQNTEASKTYLEQVWGAKHPSLKWILQYQNNSAAQFDRFPAWYKKYLGAITNTDIKSVNIIKKQVRFTEDKSVKEISSDTIRLIQ